MTDDDRALLRAVLAGQEASHARQEAILAELRALRVAVERTAQVEPPPDAANVRLLRAIYAACGKAEKVFTCASLIQDADPELRAAIVGAVGSLNANKLGKRLSSIEGQNIGGLRVHRLSERSHVALWVVKGDGGV